MLGAAALIALCWTAPALSGRAEEMKSASGLKTELTVVKTGAMIGAVEVTEGPGGAVFTYNVRGLTPGPHGFHIHQNGSCAASVGPDGAAIPAGAAGSHFDPAASGKHEGPEGQGHLGDLPFIVVREDGAAEGSVRAPRLTDLAPLAGRALIIHVDGDNYSDAPKPLGGGGGRFACGFLR
jgi:Cu-Zn family superoxide dismutase